MRVRLNRIIDWLLTPVSRAYVAPLFVLICFVGGGAWKLTASDEHSACIIQARGLPAGHELAASMADIHALLTLPPTSTAQRLAAKNTPANVTAIIADLNMHLAKYSAAEDKQPAHRSC